MQSDVYIMFTRVYDATRDGLILPVSVNVSKAYSKQIECIM